MIPVYINCRDRLTDLKLLIEWLEKARTERIVLIDNYSSYEPLLEYYETTPHEVVRLDHNHGHLAIWRVGLVPDEPFVYTDPDVVPIGDCPDDLFEIYQSILNRYPELVKIGPDLWTEDLIPNSSIWHCINRYTPESYLEKTPDVWYASIDTTMALYRPNAEFTYDQFQCARTGYPLMARHMSWYHEDPPFNEEDTHYLTHADHSSSWAKGRAQHFDTVLIPDK